MTERPVEAKSESDRVANPSPERVWTQDDIDDDNEYEDDEDDWLEQECGLMADGQCAMAGTEHCDFTCPNRDSEDFAGSEAWRKKHERAAPFPRPSVRGV